MAWTVESLINGFMKAFLRAFGSGWSGNGVRTKETNNQLDYVASDIWLVLLRVLGDPCCSDPWME